MGSVQRIPRDFTKPLLAYRRYQEALEEASRLRVRVNHLEENNKVLRKAIIKTRYERKIVMDARREMRRVRALQARIDFEEDVDNGLRELD